MNRILQAAGALAAVAVIASCSSGPTALEKAHEECDSNPLYITLGDEGRSLSISGEGDESPGADIVEIVCILAHVEVSDSVLSRIDSTRALDGRQAGEWQNGSTTFSASWGYHPNSGLNLVIDISR